MPDVLRKIQIVVRERSSDIIIHLVSGFCHLLIFGNDFVVAALSPSVWTHQIMDLLTAVYAQHHIRHLFIDKGKHLVI